MIRWLRHRLGKSTVGNKIDKKRWEHLESVLGFTIDDETLLFERALRHRSIIDGDKYAAYETYERLEFLGDAVLDLIVTEIIFEFFPKKDEGFLTKLRAKLVRGDTLADLALHLGLNEILEVGDRARGQGIELSRSVLADIFESLVAAIYLSHGYKTAFDFVNRVILDHIHLDEMSRMEDNYKSLLLEFTQAHKLSLPEYIIVSEDGPGHDKTFRVKVIVDDHEYGAGEGKSKKQAEQAAAEIAYQVLNADYS